MSSLNLTSQIPKIYVYEYANIQQIYAQLVDKVVHNLFNR